MEGVKWPQEYSSPQLVKKRRVANTNIMAQGWTGGKIRKKKKNLPPKTSSENTWPGQPQPQVQHHSPKESFNQQKLVSGTHACSFLDAFSMHFLKVKEQEVHSQPDEEVAHASRGSLVEFTFLQIFSSSSHKYGSIFSPDPLLPIHEGMLVYLLFWRSPACHHSGHWP